MVWTVGSGPTEAMWKNLSLRLKRPGMKRATDRAEGMMNLGGVYKSGPKNIYGK